MIYYYCLLLLNFICSIILVNTSRPKCFHSFLCFFSSTSMLSRVWRSLYRRWVLFGPSKDFLQTSHVSRPVWGASMDADPFSCYWITTSIFLISVSTVQTRIQSPWLVRHRLNCQTVATPVWHGKGRFCPALQQEHYCHIPAPLPLPFGWQGQTF